MIQMTPEQAWETYVGSQSPREFFALSGYTHPSCSVFRYVSVAGSPKCQGLVDDERFELFKLLDAHLRENLVKSVCSRCHGSGRQSSDEHEYTCRSCLGHGWTWPDRQHEKQASRDADARDLESGTKSREQLRQENGKVLIDRVHWDRVRAPR